MVKNCKEKFWYTDENSGSVAPELAVGEDKKKVFTGIWTSVCPDIKIKTIQKRFSVGACAVFGQILVWAYRISG